jgi:hypothetical protein
MSSFLWTAWFRLDVAAVVSSGRGHYSERLS